MSRADYGWAGAHAVHLRQKQWNIINTFIGEARILGHPESLSDSCSLASG
jgi:hypothetical protein